eukprot:3876933-Amphidinium_carterae.2
MSSMRKPSTSCRQNLTTLADLRRLSLNMRTTQCHYHVCRVDGWPWCGLARMAGMVARPLCKLAALQVVMCRDVRSQQNKMKQKL